MTVSLAQIKAYAKRHPVVPVDGEKQPLVTLSEATRDPDGIGRMWGKHPEAGVALRCDGLVVVDAAPGADAEVERLVRTLPETRRQLSPSGGVHHFYRRPAGSPLKSRALAEGVTLITGPSAYVVVAPSQNGAGPYKWENPDVEIAMLPDDLALALDSLPFLEAEARERQKGGQGGVLLPPNPEEAKGESVEKAADLRPNSDESSDDGRSDEKAADLVGVGRTTVALVAPLEHQDLAADVNLTDVGNGIRIAVRHGHDLRYCHPFARWFVWDGRRWADDDTGEPVRRAKESARWLAASALEIRDDKQRERTVKWALESERDARVRAALAMAQSETGIPLLADALDVDTLLLNVKNGTVDLRTGELRDHDRANLITKLAPVPHDRGAKCDLWQSVLERALPDPELRVFLQRLVGYSLTGETGEQIIAILYGAGANSKSTIIQTILTMLGDYAQQAPAETFLDRTGGVPNDVARLRGARMVAASEIGEGRRLNEALVKRMTGGDTLTARFMRAEWFEFQPTFTPWLATNHKPDVRGTDEAIWRRIRLIPFTVTIPEAERDPHLQDRLRDELPGILAWAVRGCLDWQKHGLGKPDAIVQATAEYRNEMDVLGAFIIDNCVVAAGVRGKASLLYQTYLSWADANGEKDKLTQQAFGRRLRERGFEDSRTKSDRWWTGIALLHLEGDG